MQNMKPGKTILTLALCCMIIAACQGKSSTQKPAAGPSAGELIPYFTVTVSPTMTVTPVNAPTATPLPTLTPTPQTYILKENDTLWTIAAKNGLTVAELEAANPDIDPYDLKAGMTIVIPAPGGVSKTETVPTPTAVAVSIHSPQCTPSLTGGLYCFAVAENQQGFDVENLVAQFILTDPETGDRYIQEGLLPLNRLTSGSSLPLFTYFAPPVPANPTVEVQLLSASPVPETGDVFLDIEIVDQKTTISADGYSATITGTVKLSNSKKSASQFWVAAVAYDSQGNIVAVRKLNQQAELSKNTTGDFAIYVYSIAGKIDHVDLFGEATP
jgi:LysM repeat protein